jgi:hypothetical protein
MSADQLAASGVFRIGDVLGQARRVFTGNLLFFLGVPALVYAAMLAAFVATDRLVGLAHGNQRLAWITFGLAAIVELGLYAIGQAVVLIGALQRLHGEPLRVGAALQRSLTRAVLLVALAVLWCLGLGICLVLAFVVPMGLWTGGNVRLVYPLVLPPLAPAAYLVVIWTVVVPACAVEGLGPLASMFRSSDLTKGSRWKIFAIVLLIALLSLAGNVIQVTLALANPVLSTVVGAAWIVVVMAFWNCTLVMTYRALRVAREGVDTGQVAAVFD